MHGGLDELHKGLYKRQWYVAHLDDM